MSKMPKKVVAITGNIASGKSAFTDYLDKLNYYVVDTDYLTKEMYEHSLEYKTKLVGLLGEAIIVDDKIDKTKVSEIVFNNHSLLSKVNDIAHPIIKKETVRLIEAGPALVFIDVPLLFEAKFDDLADEIILIVIDKQIQIDRLMKRNDLSKEQALQRINAQMPQENKVDKATYVIDNSKTLEDLYNQIDTVLQEIEKRK